MKRSLSLFAVALAGIAGLAHAQDPTWKFGPPMPERYTAVSAAKDCDGRIYVLGGVLRNVPTDVVMCFDETNAQDPWVLLDGDPGQPRPRMSIPRGGPGVAADYLGRIYAFGGSPAPAANPAIALRTAERYDPQLDQWEPIADLPRGVVSGKAVADSTGTSIFHIGGFFVGADGVVNWDAVVADVWRYDVLANKWHVVPSMNVARVAHGAALGSDGKIYVAGGMSIRSDPPTAASRKVECYDPANPNLPWTALPAKLDLNHHAHNIGTMVGDACGFLYVIGGWNPGYRNAVEHYNVFDANPSWTLKPFSNINQARNNMASVFANSGRIYVFGGDASFREVNTVEHWLACGMPEPCVIEVTIDIKPGSCPNPLGVKKKEDLPAAILGTDELHVADIDPGSVTLAGVPLLRYSWEDVATPFEGSVGDGASCMDCTKLRKDGYLDLTLKFDTQAVVAALETQLGRSLVHNECLVLTLEGELWDGTPFLGRDVVTVKVE